MKLRFDFVTNSSSCSFVIYGIKTSTFEEHVDLEKIFEIIKHRTKEFNSYNSYTEVKEEKILSTFYELCDIFNLDISTFDYYDDEYIGYHPEFLEENYPNVKLGDLRQFISNLFNNLYTNNVYKKDVEFINEIVNC